MKEVKFKTRISSAVDAFFESAGSDRNGALNRTGDTRPRKSASEMSFAAAPKPLIDFLKQSLLFFPGAFLLFFMSMGTGIEATRALVELDRGFFFPKGFLIFSIIGLLASLMTWAGLGDLKNKRHLAIPASIIAAGAAIGVAVKLTEPFLPLSERVIQDFGYAIWFFPIALIVPFLAKGWIDRKKLES